MNLKKIFVYIVIVLSFVACNIKDVGNTEGPITYNPTFSFPIGTYNLTYDDIFANMDLPPADTALADSLFLVWFEDNFYTDTIGYYDTTITFNFSFNFLAAEQEYIKSILFRINYLSELPSRSYMQVYFNGALGNRADSLFLDGPLMIEPADTNADGFVEHAELQQKDILFDESRLDLLLTTYQIELQVGIQTRKSDVEYFKYLARYKLYIQMGMRVELEAVYD